MIVKTKLAEQAEQFELDGVHYVGRRVLCQHETIPLFDDSLSWDDIDQEILHNRAWRTWIQFQLDDDRGQVFVDPSRLLPYPSSKIEEPTK